MNQWTSCQVALTVNEHDRLRYISARNRVSISDFLRAIVVDAIVDEEQVYELQRVVSEGRSANGKGRSTSGAGSS